MIKILDFLSSILILISLNLVTKNIKFWLLYSLGSVMFVIVCIANKLVGLTIMGIILTFTGIRNYLILKKRNG